MRENTLTLKKTDGSIRKSKKSSNEAWFRDFKSDKLVPHHFFSSLEDLAYVHRFSIICGQHALNMDNEAFIVIKFQKGKGGKYLSKLM